MRLALLGALLALAGCDDQLYPFIGDGGAQVTYTANWDGTQQFFGDQCDSCHPSLSDPDLEADIAADINNGTGRYVVPFEPENSELYLIITGQSDEIALMPLGAAQPLPAEVTQPIADWIADGASLE